MCKTCGCKDAETLEGEDCGCKHENEAESFGAEEWDFGNDREALRNSDENSDFNNAWRKVFRTERRDWPSWGQKFYDKYKWTLEDSTWNPYAKGGIWEDEEDLMIDSFEADGDIHYVVETIKNNKVISKSKHFNNSKDALKLFKKKTSNKSKDEEIQVMEYRDYGKAGKDKGNLFGESIYADEQGVYGAESFEAEKFPMPKLVGWEESKEVGGHYGALGRPIITVQHTFIGPRGGKKIEEVTYEANSKYTKTIKRAESFEADDDYVIVDRGNYRVRVHKKNLDRFNRSTMHKIHSDKNKEGLMYDEETSRWIPLEAESFEAHDPSHIYPSEELTPSHSHSSETFKSSNNNNNTMAAESKFDKLSDKIAKQYRKKGMSAKEAKEIGNKTAYTIGRKKYGKAGMAKKARAGMRAESFEAQGNPNKTTTSINPKFFVGKGDGDDLRGKGKFMKYNDALAKAQEVAEKEGKSRVVNNRGFALWTHDGQGLFQKGKSTTQAKKYYRAEEYSIGSGFKLGFGLGLGMLALSTVTTIAALAASTIDERQVEK